MKTYIVEYSYQQDRYVEVEADSVEDAMLRANDGEGLWRDDQVEIIEWIDAWEAHG